LREVGQALFYPPNVKGWDGGRAWVNSSTLVGRANLVYQLIRDEKTRFASGSFSDWLKSQKLSDQDAFLDWFSTMFLAVPISDSQRMSLRSSQDAKSEDRMFREMICLMAAMPQFQLS
jgi:hypothetical protein